MNQHDGNGINLLMGQFMDLQERWEDNPSNFSWVAVQALATAGAQAYNEGAGPSFHALALDGVEHSELHERFLGYLLDAGFDPFKLAKPGSGHAAIPVMSHASLAEAARKNRSSARMLHMVMDRARATFEPLVQAHYARAPLDAELVQMALASSESVPVDILELLVPAQA